ncbi:replication endonuclease [Vreelandella neptunia]|uniref:Replication endonuclease n=1 Tax=Vreelandella neptunia TaxID=115551 RepID=A0ABZ0YSR3_9GAMM|nr:replication endonuclease [Halomonas neptunia]MDN3562138.1 replication endonuclease [Halomonas neptunia]WQH15223.1 replication endonuclease [Halomonas neptunia]
MTAIEQSRKYGAPGTRNSMGCAEWRQQYFDKFPTWADQLAAGFVYVAKQHGNAAGNRWLRRNTQGLIEPSFILGRFLPIRSALTRAMNALVNRGSTTIEGLHAASEWIESVEKRLIIGSLNATHDDDALVNYAQAQAAAIDKNASLLIGDIAKANRLQRLGIFPPPKPKMVAVKGKPLSEQFRDYQDACARARNQFTPPPFIGNFRFQQWHYMRPLCISVVRAAAIEQGRHRCAMHGIAPPSEKLPAKTQLAKLSCPSVWRRKLRRLCGRTVEQVMREAHRVHMRAGIYCSDFTVERRRSQVFRNHALLETLEAINQEGQTYTLAELAELGLANPDHRRAELMLRISDTEAEARRHGHVGMFYTMTAPSKYHPVVASNCFRNPKYKGATPRETQQYLQGLWAKIRAKLARDDIGIYGIRVVEPHHDGTPHWHLLIWMKPEDEGAVTGTLREYAEEAHHEELFNRWGKTTARFDAKRIDYEQGTAAGYVAKYISKNINGEQFMEMDKYGREMKTSAPRIEAWASVWGIRQFQFLGLPSVTVWREVRRLTEKQDAMLKDWEAATNPHPCAAMRFAQIRKAANAGQWDQFLRLMGGPMTKRKDQPIKPWVETKMNMGANIETFSHATGEYYGSEAMVAKGRYGEEQKVTFGLVATGRPGFSSEYMTRVYKWQVRAKGAGFGVDFQAVGEAESPWTRVTNCTQGPDIQPREPSPAELKAQLERFKAWQSSDFYKADREAEYEDAKKGREAARQLFASAPPSPYSEQEEFFPPELG